MTFTGEKNDEGYFNLTTTFSLKPTNQTSNPLSGVLIGISENSMETTGIISLKQRIKYSCLNTFFRYDLKD